jgi:lipopolysaccharide export LptBFGC system permease protein LptF
MNSRQRRSLLLALLASAVLAWSAIYHFDIPPREMAQLLLYSAAGVLGIMLCAAVFVALLVLLRTLWRRRRD